MDVALIIGHTNVWVVAVAYALFMASSGFVLVPDQTHALNQLPARLNADGLTVMNTVQRLAGAIGTAVASALITEYSASARRSGASAAEAYRTGFASSIWVIAGLAIAGMVLAVLMFRFSTRRPLEMTKV